MSSKAEKTTSLHPKASSMMLATIVPLNLFPLADDPLSKKKKFDSICDLKSPTPSADVFEDVRGLYNFLHTHETEALYVAENLYYGYVSECSVRFLFYTKLVLPLIFDLDNLVQH